MNNKNNDPIHYSNSPMKFLGAVAQLAGGLIGRGKKKDALKAANTQAELDKEAYRNTEITNPYENLQNTAEDLTVNTQEADMQRDMMQQQQANMMGSMEQAGSFDAGNIQAMMGAASQSARQASASIGAQESANQKMAAQQASSNQMATAQGEAQRQANQADMNANLMNMSREDAANAQGAVDQSTADIVGGASGVVGGIAGMLSERSMKKNIKKVGESPSGLNVYNFEYKNKKHGEGKFQGAMADEVPSYAVVSRPGKPDMVNYSLIDVVAKSIKGNKK
ncbi:hypothetical protein N9998_00975 [Nitrosopumilus sp.]|nr:hypothetical protein [Nitrosopumilus sp.]